MPDATWLQPRNIHLYHDPRRYVNHDTGHTYAVSITTAIGRCTLTDGDREHIERHRPTWEPRGVLVHLVLEHFLKTGEPPQDELLSIPAGEGALWWLPQYEGVTLGDFRDWWEPLLSHVIWQQVQVVASELVVASDRDDWAGTLDLAVKWPDGSHGVLDLKTKGSKSSKKQDVRPQLGAATQALNDTYGLICSRNAVLWAYPGQTRLEPFDADDCLTAWRDLWDGYVLTHRAF